jgi:predicted aspartyl protease
MGISYVHATVNSNGRKARLRFLVDSGAQYKLLPYQTWQTLRLKRKRKETFELADGTTVDRDVSECYITIPKLGEAHTPVILGEPGDEALLGVITLEIIGLVLNPFTRKLQPMRMMLA